MITADTLIEICYFVATALFILSLKWLSSPATARRGVLAGEIGMALAIGGTLMYQGIVEYKWIAIALVLGTIIGVPLGKVAEQLPVGDRQPDVMLHLAVDMGEQPPRRAGVRLPGAHLLLVERAWCRSAPSSCAC